MNLPGQPLRYPRAFFVLLNLTVLAYAIAFILNAHEEGSTAFSVAAYVGFIGLVGTVGSLLVTNWRNPRYWLFLACDILLAVLVARWVIGLT